MRLRLAFPRTDRRANTLFMDPKAVAAANFGKGLACSQAVFGAFAGKYGLSAEMAVKISAGFAGGMGRTGGTCGAVTGGIMVLGLAFTTNDPDPRVSREPANRKTAEFIRRFPEVWNEDIGEE